MRRWHVGLNLIIGLTLLGAGCVSADNSFTELDHVVRFGTTPETTVHVFVANEPNELAEGLGNKPPLQPGEGMAFVFSTSTVQSFWMKDTEFPIDLVWVQHGVIEGITPNVMPEAEGTPLSQYQSYSSGTPANMVIELPAGYTAQHGIITGLAATLD